MKTWTVLLATLCAFSLNAATISFSQGINESGVNLFTTIEAIAVDGTTSITASDGGTLVSPQYEVWAFTPAIDNFTFTITGTANNVGLIDFFALKGSIIIDGATFQCTGGCNLVGNTILSNLWVTQRNADLAQAGVPEPAPLSLIGAGLIGVGLILKRKRHV